MTDAGIYYDIDIVNKFREINLINNEGVLTTTINIIQSHICRCLVSAGANYCSVVIDRTYKTVHF